MMLTKSSLAIQLSKLKVFSEPKVKLEQYPTDSEIAADMLWTAYMQGDIQGKKILDAGCGTGILGIGALRLGAKHVSFLDCDESALQTCKENLKSETSCTMLQKDIADEIGPFDVILQNPPFGSKNKHADKHFLQNAFRMAPVIYSLHTAVSKEFLEQFVSDNGFTITHMIPYKFPLKQTYTFHRRRIQRIDVVLIRAVKSKPF